VKKGRLTMTKAINATERKRLERKRDIESGLVRRDVKAHVDDWPVIRELEAKLRSARVKFAN